MECRKLRDATEFLLVAENSLIKHETEHNLVLGLATNVAQDRMPATHALFFSVFEREEPIGHAVTTHPDRPLALSKMESGAIDVLVRHVLSSGVHLSGVVGPIQTSEGFAQLWEAATKKHSRLVMHQGVYQLDRVTFPEADGGKLVPIANVSDDIILRYVLGLLHDAVPEEKHPQRIAEESLQRHRKNQTLFFWQVGEGPPVSMAAQARQTRNGATIGLVYTPPELRRRGYAGRLVAALSDMQLKAGKQFCNLFTDLQNATSNSIYQKIGYQKIGESKHFAFE